jgi:Deoxynucleotide monophosphate kinase
VTQQLRVVGITGKARAGKDSVASWFEKRVFAARESFAYPMKIALADMLGTTYDEMWGDAVDKEAVLPGLGVSRRQLAQTIGTEWGREEIGKITGDKDWWIKLAAARMARAFDEVDEPLFVISDVRFENEAAFVRKHGVLFHVRRDGADGNVGLAGHKSEGGIEVLDVDRVIINDGDSLDALYETLDFYIPRDRVLAQLLGIKHIDETVGINEAVAELPFDWAEDFLLAVSKLGEFHNSIIHGGFDKALTMIGEVAVHVDTVIEVLKAEAAKR